MSLFEQKSLLAKLMATENMRIQQSNVATASFDVKNRVLTVPILDNNLSKEVYDLFMGHECGHALWTPLDGMQKAKKEKVNMSVLNVVEDSRIERKIKTKYPGIKSSFVKGYSELFEQNFFDTKGKELSEYNFIDKVNLHCKIGAALTLPFDDEEKMLLNEVESTETFEDSVEVTKKICEFMVEQMIEVPEPKEVKVRIKFEGEGDIEDGEPGGSGEDGDENDSDIDVEITVQKSDESAAPQEGQGAGKNSSETGSGAGRNLQDLIDTGKEGLDEILQIAKAGQHPRAFEVYSGLLKNLVDANKELLATQKQIREMEGVKKESSGTNIDKAIFVGSTNELNKFLKGKE